MCVKEYKNACPPRLRQMGEVQSVPFMPRPKSSHDQGIVGEALVIGTMCDPRQSVECGDTNPQAVRAGGSSGARE